MNIQEFSEYEKNVINAIIAFDKNRNEWENNIGIPVLTFISVFFSKLGLYPSIDKEKIVFAFSLKSNDKKQQEIIDNQRAVIFALHLLEKLKTKGYIVCLNLNDSSLDIAKEGLPIYGISSELKEMKIKFSIDELQGVGKGLINQAIVITEDLKRISNQGFKTVEQIRYENEIQQMHTQIIKANKQIIWAKYSFFVAIGALVLSFISLVLVLNSNDNITKKDLEEIVNKNRIPDVISAQLSNDTIKAVIVSQPQKKSNKQTIKPVLKK